MRSFGANLLTLLRSARPRVQSDRPTIPRPLPPARGLPTLGRLDTQTDKIVQLKQINAGLMAQKARLLTQLATAYQQVASVFGAVDRLDSAPAPPWTAPTPFQDWLPQVAADSGEPGRARKALLAQFYLHAWRIPSLPSGAPAALIDWQAHQCGPNTPTRVPATRHRPSGPRSRWGCARLRPGVRRLQSPPHPVSLRGTVDPTRLSGSCPSGSTSARSRRASTGAGKPPARRNAASVAAGLVPGRRAQFLPRRADGRHPLLRGLRRPSDSSETPADAAAGPATVRVSLRQSRPRRAAARRRLGVPPAILSLAGVGDWESQTLPARAQLRVRPTGGPEPSSAPALGLTLMMFSDTESIQLDQNCGDKRGSRILLSSIRACRLARGSEG